MHSSQLGHGELSDSVLPRAVEALAGQRVAAAACGLWHTAAVTADGALWTWGAAGGGRLGHGPLPMDGNGMQVLPKRCAGEGGPGG